MDSGQRILEKDGVLVAVSPKAIDLLIVLVERAGEVVAKDTLFDTIWPETFVVESSLTKNICVLRKVLDDPAAPESVIQTASKRGYRFVGNVVEEAPGHVSLQAPRSSLSAKSVRGNRVRLELVTLGGIVLLVIVLFPQKLQVNADKPLGEAERLNRIARHLWSKADRAEIQKALQHFQKAAEVDPRSAMAHAGIADAYVLMTTLGVGGAPELSEARQSATRAVELDREQAGPHVSLGWVFVLKDFDFKAAAREYQRALELDRNSVPALYSYASLLAHAGSLQAARDLIQRAQQLDPVSPLVGTEAGRIEYYGRKYQHAIEILKEVLDREPLFPQAHYYMAMSLGQLGRVQEARASLRRARPHSSLLATDEAWLDTLAGDQAPARALVEERRMLGVAPDQRATALMMPAIDAGDLELHDQGEPSVRHIAEASSIREHGRARLAVRLGAGGFFPLRAAVSSRERKHCLLRSAAGT